MKIFTIENESNNVTLHGSIEEAEAVPNAERFRNEAALAKLAADWPASRLIEIWNSLPGATEVKKFKDRATAVSRIWKAVQSLGQTAPSAEETLPVSEASAIVVAEQTPELADQPEAVIPESAGPDVPTDIAPQAPDVAREPASSGKKGTRAKKAPKPATDGQPREGSKTSQVIVMLKKEGGTTLEEIMTAMGWLKHTTRAMLSAVGSLTKNHGLVILSEKVGDKRVYSVKA